MHLLQRALRRHRCRSCLCSSKKCTRREGHGTQLGDADEGEAGLQQRQQGRGRQRRHPTQQRLPRPFQHRLVRVRPGMFSNIVVFIKRIVVFTMVEYCRVSTPPAPPGARPPEPMQCCRQADVTKVSVCRQADVTLDVRSASCDPFQHRLVHVRPVKYQVSFHDHTLQTTALPTVQVAMQVRLICGSGRRRCRRCYLQVPRGWPGSAACR